LSRDRGAGAALVRDHQAVDDLQNMIAAPGKPHVMGYQQKRGAMLPRKIEQQVHDLPAGGAVEVAGRFVGKQQLGLRREGARNGHALLLAAGQLRGIMQGAGGKPDLAQRLLGAREGVGTAGKLQRQGDVLQRRHGGDEMETLEDDADALAPQAGQTILVEAGEIGAGNVDLAGGGALEPADDHHQARLAGARRADKCRNLAFREVNIDAAQDVDRSGTTCHVEVDIAELDHRAHRLIRRGPDGLGRDSMLTRYGVLRAAVNRRGVLLGGLVLAIGGVGAAEAQAKRQIRIAMLGDSLTAGLGVKSAEAVPARIEARLRAQGLDVVVFNHGVSGDTTEGGAQRIDWMLSDSPDIVIVALGANDALRALDPGEAERNLDGILTRLEAAKVEILLAGMLAPRNYGAEYTSAFDGLYARLAARHKVTLYPFLLDGVAMDPALNQADGIHPNARGADAIATRMLPVLRQVIERWRARSGAG